MKSYSKLSHISFGSVEDDFVATHLEMYVCACVLNEHRKKRNEWEKCQHSNAFHSHFSTNLSSLLTLRCSYAVRNKYGLERKSISRTTTATKLGSRQNDFYRVLWKSYKFCTPISWQNSTSTPTEAFNFLISFFFSQWIMCMCLVVCESSSCRKDGSSQYPNGARFIIACMMNFFRLSLCCSEKELTLLQKMRLSHLFHIVLLCTSGNFGMILLIFPTWNKHAYSTNS